MEDSSTTKKWPILREILSFAFIVVFVVIPLRYFIAEPYLVSGTSMFPTFDTGHYLIVDKISYRFKSPKRFDVLVMKYPKDTSKDFLKRIVGLPNETIIIRDGVVSIKNKEFPDGFVLSEKYITLPKIENLEKIIGPDEYFVMGDNRDGSFDSRYWGSLPKEDIIGKPILRLLPISKIGINPGAIKN